jgi:SpoVK/Ycf46/Vps4 family AAA+-type ATPase
MTALTDRITALVHSHAAGDDETFYAVALQVAAQEARRGHNRVADDLRKTIDASRRSPVVRGVTPIAQPRGDLGDLVTASFPKVGLGDLIGPEPLLDKVRRVITEQQQRQRLSERGFTPAHRLLLEGPPGTGKTMTAAVLAHELGLPLLTVRLDSLLSKYMGETAAKLRTVFDAAAKQRAVYLFDEFDALGADRASNDVGEARRILNSFLVFLEEPSSESVVVAATNHRTVLDRALFRRFDMLIVYDMPTAGEGLDVLRARLGPISRGVVWRKLEDTVLGLSHGDLIKAAEDAAKQALMRGDERVTHSDLRTALEVRQQAHRA